MIVPDSPAAIPPLLCSADPPAFELFNAEGRAPILFVCDHAGRAIPAALARLGLDEAALERHIAWDIGIADLTRALAECFDAPVVLSNYCRLVIDCNRRLDHPTSIPPVSDRVKVPANQELTPARRQARIDACFWPYHNEIERVLAGFERRKVVPVFISMHSFTPIFQKISELLSSQRIWRLKVYPHFGHCREMWIWANKSMLPIVPFGLFFSLVF